MSEQSGIGGSRMNQNDIYILIDLYGQELVDEAIEVAQHNDRGIDYVKKYCEYKDYENNYIAKMEEQYE